MINKAKALINHPLFSGSVFMLVGTNLANGIAFVYHFLLGRALGSVLYGELASVISLIGISGVVYTAGGVVIVKFISSVKNAHESDILYTWLYSIFTRIAVVGLIILVLLSPLIAAFLQINIILALLTGPVFFFSTMTVLDRAVLQAKLKFRQVVTSVILEVIIRLVVSLSLTLLGWGSFGASLGIFIGVSLSWIYLHRLVMESTKRSKGVFSQSRQLFKYFIPVFIQTLALSSFFASDVLLVKHFLNQHDAGQYAALSALGKIVFYAISPVASVMFPVVSGRHAKGQSHARVFWASLGITTMFLIPVLGIYKLVPQIPVTILFGDSYLPISAYLFGYGLFMGVFSLASQMVSYFFSIGLTASAIPYALSALVQVCGIAVFHRTLWDVVNINLVASVILLLFMLVYGYNYTWKTNGTQA